MAEEEEEEEREKERRMDNYIEITQLFYLQTEVIKVI